MSVETYLVSAFVGDQESDPALCGAFDQARKLAIDWFAITPIALVKIQRVVGEGDHTTEWYARTAAEAAALQFNFPDEQDADAADFTATLAAIKASRNAMLNTTCAMVEQRLAWLWDERPAVDDFDDEVRFDIAATAYADRFQAFLPSIWELSTCKDAELMARFAEDENTSGPVFATDTQVLEFDDAHRFGVHGSEYFAIHTWTKLYPKIPWAMTDEAAPQWVVIFGNVSVGVEGIEGPFASQEDAEEYMERQKERFYDGDQSFAVMRLLPPDAD